MQRIAPNAMPPRKSGTNQPCGGKGEEESPAYRMARRIQREQGPQRATQYLNAMEPFLAPAERAHIAERLGLRLSTPSNAPFTPPHGPGDGGSCQGNGTQGPKPNAPGMGGAPGMGAHARVWGQPWLQRAGRHGEPDADDADVPGAFGKRAGLEQFHGQPHAAGPDAGKPIGG